MQYRRQSDYFAFVNRLTRSSGEQPFSVPAGALLDNSTAQVSFPILTDQAVKLASLDATVFDPNNPSAKALQVQDWQINVSPNGGTIFGRQYPGFWNGTFLGNGGMGLHVFDPEWLFWNDYTEQNSQGSVGDCIVSVSVDMLNTDGAGAHDFHLLLTAVIEYFEKQKIDPNAPYLESQVKNRVPVNLLR